MTMRPVAITGLGLVCSLGTTREAVVDGLRAGRRPFAPVQLFDASGYRANLAAQVPNFVMPRNLSRTDALALHAATQALDEADLSVSDREQAAVYVGASTGGMLEMEHARGAGRRPSLATYRNYPVWATTNLLQHRLQLLGPVATYMTACSSAAHALGLAMQRVRSGQLEVALAGGAEALSRLTLSGFGSLGVLDASGTRPFDSERQGITLGEGAAFLVLEPLERAQARGAKVLAVLAGYGASADAHHMTQPKADGSGAFLAMQSALHDAGLTAGDIQYINAHGTGTKHNDAMEAQAIVRLMGANPAFVSSPKSMLGHTLGAAGALEAAVSVLSLQGSFVPPSTGVGAVLPELGSLQLAQHAVEMSLSGVLSSSFAFGGNNAALVFAREDVVARRSWARARVTHAVVTGGAVLSPHGLCDSPKTLSALVDALPLSERAWHDLDPGEVLGKGTVRRMDALSAHASALFALVQRQRQWEEAHDVAMSFGTAFGALDASITFLERLFAKGPGLVNPLEFPNLVHNAPLGHASIALGARGANVASCQEELSGDEALALMLDTLALGHVQRALVGGGDLASTWLDEGYAALLGNSPSRASGLGVVALETASVDGWARVLGHASCGPHLGLHGAVTQALARAGCAAVDVWLASDSESLGEGVAQRCVPLRKILGSAQGLGPAAVAIAAAHIQQGHAGTVLITSATRSGAATAFVLGALS